MSGWACPKCGSSVLIVTTKPDLLRDGCQWVLKCGGDHVVTPVESDELRIEFG